MFVTDQNNCIPIFPVSTLTLSHVGVCSLTGSTSTITMAVDTNAGTPLSVAVTVITCDVSVS